MFCPILLVEKDDLLLRYAAADSKCQGAIQTFRREFLVRLATPNAGPRSERARLSRNLPAILENVSKTICLSDRPFIKTWLLRHAFGFARAHSAILALSISSEKNERETKRIMRGLTLFPPWERRYS
jgi:hypothetical protein